MWYPLKSGSLSVPQLCVLHGYQVLASRDGRLRTSSSGSGISAGSWRDGPFVIRQSAAAAALTAPGRLAGRTSTWPAPLHTARAGAKEIEPSCAAPAQQHKTCVVSLTRVRWHVLRRLIGQKVERELRAGRERGVGRSRPLAWTDRRTAEQKHRPLVCWHEGTGGSSWRQLWATGCGRSDC